MCGKNRAGDGNDACGEPIQPVQPVDGVEGACEPENGQRPDNPPGQGADKLACEGVAKDFDEDEMPGGDHPKPNLRQKLRFGR